MALVFDTTISSPTFNAYCTVAELEDYCAMKLNTNVPAMSIGNKQALIVWASKLLNSVLWYGIKVDALQPMEFPRAWLPIEGGYTGDWSTDLNEVYYFPTNAIPRFLKDATAELATQLAVEDVTEDDGSSQLKSVKVDSIAIEYKNSSRMAWLKSSVKNIIFKYMKNGSGLNVPTVRVG